MLRIPDSEPQHVTACTAQAADAAAWETRKLARQHNAWPSVPTSSSQRLSTGKILSAVAFLPLSALRETGRGPGRGAGRARVGIVKQAGRATGGDRVCRHRTPCGGDRACLLAQNAVRRCWARARGWAFGRGRGEARRIRGARVARFLSAGDVGWGGRIGASGTAEAAAGKPPTPAGPVAAGGHANPSRPACGVEAVPSCGRVGPCIGALACPIRGRS